MNRQTIVLAFLVALGAVIGAGLVAIPIIEQSALADKGGEPHPGSNGNGRPDRAPGPPPCPGRVC